MVLRGVPEDGRQTSSAGGHHVFCALTLLDHRPLDWDPTGLSPRRDRFRRSVRRARGLCRLSRVCDPRSLDDSAREPAWGVAPRVVTAAASVAPGDPQGLDRAGTDGSWSLCSLAVPADCPLGVASLPPDQPGCEVPARGSSALVLAAGVSRAGRATLARVWHGVSLPWLAPRVHGGG